MIRVVHMVEDLKTGGMEKVIAAIALNIDKTKYDVSVWCVARGGAIADELVQKGVPLEILGIASYFNPVNIFKLAAKLRKARPTIIHTHGYFAGTVGRLAGLLAGTRILFHHVHSTYSGYSKRNIAIERILGFFTYRVLCCSQAVADHVFKSESIPRLKIAVVYNGIPPHQTSGRDLEMLRVSLGIKTDDRVIVSVASLVENKGHACLIEALGRIATYFPRLKLLIVGDGVLRKQLERQAVDLHIMTQVIFAGIRHDIPDILAIAEHLLLVSRHREGMGIALVEAMAAGKPVIGTRVGGIPEVIQHNKTGLIVPPSDSNALAMAIRDLLSNPRKTREFGENGRQRFFDLFTEEKMIRAIEQLYNGAIAK